MVLQSNPEHVTVPLLHKEYECANEEEKSATIELHLSHSELQSRMNKRRPANLFIRVLATIYLWIMLSLGLLFSFVTQVFFWIIMWPIFICRPSFRMRLMGSVFRFYQNLSAFWLNPFWSVQVVRLPHQSNFKPDGNILWICNHLTGADPWIFNKAFWPWEMKWVYKADLHRIPIAGQVVQLAGDHPLYFTKDKGGWGTPPGSVKSLMERVLNMRDHHDIGTVVFPEGTRSKSGRLQPFKDGFFRFAIEHGFKLVPCVTHNSPILWPLGSAFFGSGTAYCAIGNPVTPQPGESVDELKRRVRNIMINMLKAMPLYNPEFDDPLPEDIVIGERGGGITGG